MAILNRLTVKEVTAAKPDPIKVVRLFDGGGLILEIRPSGQRAWHYKFKLHGRDRRMSLGPAASISLAEARELRRKAQVLVAKEIDPIAARQKRIKAEQAKHDAAKLTFGSLVWPWSDQYHEREVLADTTKTRNERILRYLEADLGKIPVALLTRKVVKKSVERIADTNGTETSHRALSLCHLFCEYLVVEDMIAGDLTVGIRKQLGKVVDKPRSAIIDPKAVGELLRSIWNYPGHAATVAAMKLLPLTMLRPGELRKTRWTEINFETREWIVPIERMKTRRTHPVDHLVPMSKQVVTILQNLKAHELDDELVFPSLRKGRPLSENAFRVALLNLGYDGSQHHAHGWRKTASSLLAKQGFDQRWIDKQLAHAVPGVSGKYQLYDFAAERRKMLQQWSDYLDQLREGGKVVAIGTAKANS